MSKIKAPQILIDTVRRVNKSEQLDAAKVAVKTYFSFLEKLEDFGDFNRQTNEELAAEAAVAEVLFRFS